MGIEMDKANLGDLIAATGLVILLKLDSNHRFFFIPPPNEVGGGGGGGGGGC